MKRLRAYLLASRPLFVIGAYVSQSLAAISLARLGDKLSEVGYVVQMCLVLAVAAAFLAYGLGAYGLFDNNEGMYATIGREMLAGVDAWVIPTLNGLPYVEKPPLLYYLLAGSFAVFGETEFAARLVPLAAGLAQLALLLWFGNRLRERRTALLAAIVLVTSLGFYIMSRQVMFDMLLSTLLNGALLCFWLALHTSRPAYQRLGLVLLALAVLTKGLVALVLYGLVVVVYAATSAAAERRAVVRVLADRSAAALFVAVALPWHMAAASADPDFFRFYFIDGQLFRFFGVGEQADYYTGTAFYYLPRVALMLMPWTLFLALPWWSGADGRLPPLVRFLLLAFVVPMVFFSLSVAKANYYMIVGLPPLAWLVAHALTGLDVARVRTRVLIAVLVPGVALGTLFLFLGAGPLIADSADMLRNTTSFGRPANSEFLDDPGILYGAAIVVFLCIGLAIAGIRRRQPWAIIASTAGFGVVGALLVVRLVVANDAHLSSRDVVRAAWPALDRVEVVLYKDLEEMSSLPFYFGRQVGILNSDSGDLRYAQRKGVYRDTFLSAEDIAERGARVIVAVRDPDLGEFEMLVREHRMSLVPLYRFTNGVSLFGNAGYAKDGAL